MENLKGKVAVVTGGASGIGRALCLVFAGEGANVVVADLDEAGMAETAAGVLKAGAKAVTVRTDVTRLASVQALAERAWKELGGAHVLCNNAGVAVHGGLESATHRDWEWVLGVNLWGVIHGVEAFVPRMIAQSQPGHIVNTASMAGLIASQGLGVYNTSKYAVVGLSETLQKDLRQYNIGVSVLCPMGVTTNIGTSERSRPADLKNPGGPPQADGIELIGRYLTPAHVAERVLRAVKANRLYVITHEEAREPLRRRFERMDKAFEESRMNFKAIDGWGKLPDGWRYVEVAGVAVDAKDNVFCFTRGDHPVIVFDRDGKFLRSWGEGLVRRAHGITIDADGMVWLTDDLHHTVRKFTPDGKCLLVIGNPDTPSTLQGGKPFNRPTHVAICPKSGYLFISDGYGNSRVHKYSPDGKHVMSWGEPGTDPGQFNLPHNLVTDRDGLVYVADRENHRVQIFDGKGTYQGQWNNLHRPCGLFVDRTQNGGTFYVGELGHALPVNASVANLGPRVTVLDAKGQKIARFGGQFAGEKPGEFVAPHGVVTDSRGDVYVSEVSWTNTGQHEKPPREIRSLQKFARTA